MSTGANWRPGKRVAVIGAGPAGISTALAMIGKGFDVRIYEKRPAAEPLGGGVLLSVPVLAILRSYGMDLKNFGAPCKSSFYNHKGRLRVALPSNPVVEEAMGIEGWHYGMLRATAFSRMLELLPAGVFVGGMAFDSYEETASCVRVHFKGGTTIEADVVVGADGIHSGVSRQAFGDPGLFHVGLRAWLAWTHAIEGVPTDAGFISHSRTHQASFYPMMHEGKVAFEWWVVEPMAQNSPPPADPKAHLRGLLKNWVQPLPRFVEATDFSTQVFRWEIYNRPSLQKWSTGRVVCVGDSVHPVSPYAAYGMGMAIEDGYFLAKFLDNRDLSDRASLEQGFGLYEEQRVGYVNHQVEFARKLGSFFHQMPYPMATIRDFVLDRTNLIGRKLMKESIEVAERETLALSELHVRPPQRSDARSPTRTHPQMSIAK